MAKVGAQRAADLTGRSKSTIQRAMKQGKISFEVDANGRRLIDVSELDRAFGLLPQGGAAESRSHTESVEAELEKAAAMLEAERMKMRIRMLEDQLDIAREQIEDLKAQRDQWQKQAQQVLITSQYSQKQAEEYKTKLDEHDRMVKMRRAQMQKQQAAGQRPAGAAVPAQGQPRKTGPMEGQRTGVAVSAAPAAPKSFDIQSLWGKIRGAGEKVADKVASTPAQGAGEAKAKDGKAA